MSPAERVIDQFKKRKEVLNRVALENCAEEQLDLSMCFKSGTVKERATMCGAKNSKFSRCYTMQIVCLFSLLSFCFFPCSRHFILMGLSLLEIPPSARVRFGLRI